MEQNTEPKMVPSIEPIVEPKSKKYSIVLIIGVVVILIGLGVWYWQSQEEKIITPPATVPTAPATAPATVKEDSTSAINQELDNIDVGDLDKEFQAIDTDLNSL
ncbi:MAG: hypothetical protein Q8N28_00660 [bacterium]|nr:hypothetical protein [bacterium]